MSLGNSPAIPSLDAGPSSSANPNASTSSWIEERAKKRIALQSANAEIWQHGPSPPSGSLDSNMKKNTGFIKRVRQSLGVETREVLIKEVATLNLDKYIDEVIQAIPEGLLKCTTAKDCLAAAEVRIDPGREVPLASWS
jgi:regulator of nonsense transcripts 2